MAPSLNTPPGRGLNLANSNDVSTNDEKGEQMIKSTFDLLEKGEKEIKFDDKYKDVILILGNTGSGKRTFTEWVAGDNTKLITKETKEGTGDYIIEDHNRIGNSTLKSKTIFPELVVDPKTNAAFYDCPGFSDTQGTSHDIATTYFIKKVVDNSASVKMIFTISHPSVRKGVDRQDFVKLLRHVTDLVKDVEKFKHSIAIVATKVDNQYIKKGKNFVLVEDNKVIAAIADFLLEVKQYLKDSSKRLNLSEKDKQFYKNAMKFVDVLLEKENEKYLKIGLFRRPDEPGPVSGISLLQNGKNAIKMIISEKLNFTAKVNEDFGYTVSEKTKIDIIEIVEEINKNLWSSIEDIAGKIKGYYENIAEQVRCQISLLISETDTVDLSPSVAKEFVHKFSNGYNVTSDLLHELKDLTNPEELAVIINSTTSNFDFNLPQENVLYIANQGKYYNFLQTVSDTILNLKPWDKLFKDVETFFSDSKTVISHDVDSALDKVYNRIQLNLNNTVKEIHEEYIEISNTLDIQSLPSKLKNDGLIISELVEEIKNGTTIDKLINLIRSVADNLGVSAPKENLQNIAVQGKNLKFLEAVDDGTYANPMALISPFKNIVKYFYESGKWYTFLDDLYKKLSEYHIQSDRQKYNVADLEDWGQSDKPQGIAITSNTFEKFLDKIGNYNVTEYGSIKNITVNGSQIDELNQVLTLTLKHKHTISCSEPYITIKGNYVSLKETMQIILSNSETNNSCNGFKDKLSSGKYTLLKVFALKTAFIDTDLEFAGERISVAIIAPKWEIMESRNINLQGLDGASHATSKAKNGEKPGNNGVNGAPGNPGGPGESFFGICTEFLHGKNLTVNSNGGNGSPAQDGGDGAPGEPGRDAELPSASDPPCPNNMILGLKCEELNGRSGFIGNDGVYTEVPFKIYGLPGGKGGDGGNGGKGAKGGKPGNIFIFNLDQPSEIATLIIEGKQGGDGKAGVGSSQGGKDGDDRTVKWTHWEPNWLGKLFGNYATSSWMPTQLIKNSGRGPAGNNGKNGTNSVDLRDPKPANGIHAIPNIINEYKSFLRENMKGRYQKHFLVEFLDQMNKKKEISKLYDTLSLLDEFQGLEGQFHKISNQVNFLPFYRSLLERINELAKSQKEDKTFGENRKVLSYMYTASLARMYNLNENGETNLIIDIRGYLNLVQENIKSLKDIQTKNNKADIIEKYKENYKIGIDKKIEEAKSFIKNQMNPELKNISAKIDDQVNALIQETIALQKRAEQERKELMEKKKELEFALAVKGLFSCFQIIGGVISFLGPIGAIAGTVIETTSTVSESLALSNQQKVLNLPSDVVSGIKSLEDQIKTLKNKKIAFLNKMLDDVSEEIKKNPKKLNDMASKIEEIKNKLKKASDNKFDFKQVKLLEVELKQELKRKGEELKSHSSDKKSVDASKVIGKIYQIAQFGSLMLNMYDKIKEDKEKMDAFTTALEKNEEKITKLKEYEERIHDTIIPMLEEMEDSLKDISNNLGIKSQVALDVTKWQVQSSLKDMKIQMQRFTEGFHVKEDLSRCIEKLDEVMTTLINIYDRIQNFQDQQNLANYIADISSVASNSINIQNEKLSKATDYLEYTIRSNILLKQYKSAIDTFKQWVFPFADLYIDKQMLPSQLELDADIQDLVQNATREIEVIKQKVDLYKVSIKKNDDSHLHGEFDSRYVSSHPFFVWKNEKYGSLISDLLSGKEVVLKADIKEALPNKDAIKFSVIDFYFRTKNETVQSLLSGTLKGFDTTATHLGNSYYRYEDKIYLITSDSVTISYANEKNDAGEPIRTNSVYDKLKSGDLILSPYTLWEIKLINKTNKYSFSDLEKLKNDVNLELSGFGSFVDKSVVRRASVAYKSFIVHNGTHLKNIDPQSIDMNECTRASQRAARSPLDSAMQGNLPTNSASRGVSSPINFVFNFLKTYFLSNAVVSFNKLFIEEQGPANDCSEFSETFLKKKERKPDKTSNPQTTTMASDFSDEELTLGIKYNAAISDNFYDNNSYKNPFLSSDQQDGMSHQQSVQVPELNCSLLLADVMTRTFTGNKYKSPVDECLISPREVIFGKISDGMVQCENDVILNLQRLQSEKDEGPCSWISKLSGYSKSIFQFLRLTVNGDVEEYVQDVRNLFA